MQANQTPPVPLVSKNKSIDTSYDLLEYAIKTNSRAHFYSLSFRDDSKLSLKEKEAKQDMIQQDYLFIQGRISAFLNLVPKDEPLHADMLFLQKKTKDLFVAFYQTGNSLASIFADQEEMEKYLSLMKTYLYEGYGIKKYELTTKFPQVSEGVQSRVNNILGGK